MSMRRRNDELLVGRGSAEPVPLSPRIRSLSHGCSPLASPRNKKPSSSLQFETMDKAKELFELCDKEGKGFITKQDMQRLQEELPLTSEQLEAVFESLDHEGNGFLTPNEFNRGLGELMRLEEMTELSSDEVDQDHDDLNWLQDPTTIRLINTLTELGADTLFQDPQDLCFLCCELQTDKPDLLMTLDGILGHVVTKLKDAIREKENLEEALTRREMEHEQVVQSVYEEMEGQIREEKKKWLAWEILKEKQKGQQLEEELKLRELELENALSKQNELEIKVRQLSQERMNISGQNQQLRSLNTQLQEQVESSKEQLQDALTQLNMLQINAAHEQTARQRNVSKVSTNMKKEKDSLMKQLEILRDMNRMLRDERDAKQVKPRVSHRHSVVPSSSPLSNYLSKDLHSLWTQQVYSA